MDEQSAKLTTKRTMCYGLEPRDESGRALAPGFYDPPLYKSESPIPIPNVGETILEFNACWTVLKREFEYGFNEEQDEDGNFMQYSIVHLECRRISNDET